MFQEFHREQQAKGLVTGPNDGTYFGTLTGQDVVEWCRPLFESRGYYLRDSDGKIDFDPRMAWDTPWHHVKHTHGLDCHLWHQVMFDIIFTRMNQPKWIPSNCHNCWKVVVRPQSLKQLFALLALQQRLGHPSKCGIEVRETVHGLYGGYFYNKSFDAGLNCFEMVREEVNKDEGLGKDVPVIFKRACTEYEMRAGPSDLWEVSEAQAHAENVIDSVFTHDIIMRNQPDWALTKVHTKWIQFAFMNADPTYKEFTGGKPLYPHYITYQHLARIPVKERAKIYEQLNTGQIKLTDLRDNGEKPKQIEKKGKKK